MEVPVDEQVAPASQHVAAPPAPVAHPGRTRAAMIVGGAALALVLAAGVFAAGVGVGRRLGGGSEYGARQTALSGRQGPGMMQGQGAEQGQRMGRGFNRGRRPGGQGGQHGGRGMAPGVGAPQGLGGQGSISPTAPGPAAPGQ